MNEKFEQGEYTVEFFEFVGEPGQEQEFEFDGYPAERWSKNGETHRENGPALIIRDFNGLVLVHQYFRNGRVHRDDGPAQIITASDDFRTETWFKDGLEHRENAPSMSVYYIPNNLEVAQRWCVNGLIGRLGGPAEIGICERTCVVESEIWKKDSQFHRIGGPAITARMPGCEFPYEEHYYFEGLHHRDDGPATVFRNGKTGQITGQKYFNMGRETGPSGPKQGP